MAHPPLRSFNEAFYAPYCSIPHFRHSRQGFDAQRAGDYYTQLSYKTQVLWGNFVTQVKERSSRWFANWIPRMLADSRKTRIVVAKERDKIPPPKDEEGKSDKLAALLAKRKAEKPPPAAPAPGDDPPAAVLARPHQQHPRAAPRNISPRIRGR